MSTDLAVMHKFVKQPFQNYTCEIHTHTHTHTHKLILKNLKLKRLITSSAIKDVEKVGHCTRECEIVHLL